MTIREFFSFKTNKYFWVNILVMIVAVVLIVFGVMKWLDVYTRHGEAVVVPDVKGMTVDEASKMFRNHGLVCVVSSFSASSFRRFSVKERSISAFIRSNTAFNSASP